MGNQMTNQMADGGAAADRSVLHAWDLEDLVLWEQLMSAPAEPRRGTRSVGRRGPAGSTRPGGAAVPHRDSGVRLSRANGPDRRRPVTKSATVGLALMAGLITLWLGVMAQLGEAYDDASASTQDRLAVVQVQSGETLAHVAARVAPDRPVGQVVDRIRELNALRSGALDAGQTRSRREGEVMHCPFCRHPDSRVVDSREADEGQAIRRRRSCPECGRRFTTVETAVLAVVKRSGVTEPFSREKVISGVRRACQGRQVDDDALNLLAQQVEDAVRAGGSPEVPSNEVGLAILGPLRELDEVAYLRFASVYRSFTSADDFEREIRALREHREISASGL